MILLVEVGNKGTGIVVFCHCVRRSRLLVWLTVACVGVDGLAGAGFCHGYLCGCTPGIEKTGSGNLKAFFSHVSIEVGVCMGASIVSGAGTSSNETLLLQWIKSRSTASIVTGAPAGGICTTAKLIRST